MLDEIAEQPAALSRLLERPEAQEAAHQLVAANPRVVRFVSHGSSHNAAVYGSAVLSRYLGVATTLPPLSGLLNFSAHADLRQDAVVAISQSGRTEDILEYVEGARRATALTIAITNDTESPLADASDIVVPLAAGTEDVIPATKTYTNTLAAIALLTGSAQLRAALQTLPELIARQIELSLSQADAAAGLLADASAAFVVGDGYELGTAGEIALKVTETSCIPVAHLGITELLHGWIAALRPGVAVLGVANATSMLGPPPRAWDRLAATGADVVAIGNAIEDLPSVRRLDVLDIEEAALAPLLTAIPGQLLAERSARLRGLDPDRPEGLTKVVAF